MSSADFFLKNQLIKKNLSDRNTISDKQFRSRSGPINVGPDLCRNHFQKLSADDIRRKIVEKLTFNELQIPGNSLLEIDSQMDMVKTSQRSQVVKTVFMSLVGDSEAVVERLQSLASRKFNGVGVVSRGHSSEVLGV